MRVPAFKILTLTGTSLVICLAVFYAYAALGKRTYPAVPISHMADNEKDSVEIIGTPTGDDPWKEVEKLVKAYYSKTGIQYSGTMEVIDDNGDREKIVETQSFSYTILNNNFHYKLAEMEVMGKKDLLLAIDHKEKTMAISRESASFNNAIFDIRTFKELLEEYKANALVTSSGAEKILTIDNIGDPSIQAYRIYYSPQTFRINKMLLGMVRSVPLEMVDDEASHSGEQKEITDEYYYYVQVNFNTVKTLNLLQNSFTPESKFIRYENGHLTLSKDYLHYRLLNSNEP